MNTNPTMMFEPTESERKEYGRKRKEADWQAEQIEKERLEIERAKATVGDDE